MIISQAQAQEILNYLWAAIGVYWVVSARSAHANREQSGELQAARILRLFILATVFTLLLSSWLRVGPLAWRFVPDMFVVRGFGLVLTICGIALMVWARRHLGVHWSDKVQIKVDHELIRSGPYATLRHPIYSGVLLAVMGTALVVGEWRGVLAFCILLANYVIKARKEERILAARFGEVFQRHKKQTGFLVPRLNAKTPSIP